MITTECSICGETETAANEIDQSICCSNCGTVLELSDLVSFHEMHYNIDRDKTKNNKGKGAELKNWWNKIAFFFLLPEDTILEGTRLIDRYYNVLPVPAIHYKEICVALAYSIGKLSKPSWTWDDYIDTFPEALHRPIVLRSCQLFEGENVETYRWVEYSEIKITSTIDSIYDCIKNQLFIENAIPANFNKKALIEMTKKLLKLGSCQGINAGKKSRILVTVVACICGLYLRSVALATHLVLKGNINRISKERTTRRRSVIDPRKESKNLTHIWSFNTFRNVISGSNKVFKKTYREYIEMLTACTEKMPWLPRPVEKKNVFFHLNDILEVFGQENDKKPLLSISLVDFAPFSFIRNRNEDIKIKCIIEKAMKYFENNEDPEEQEREDARVCDAYLALQAGYQVSEMELWTRNRFKTIGEMLKFRKMHPLNIDEWKNSNLNRINIKQDDIGEKELDFYVSVQ